MRNDLAYAHGSDWEDIDVQSLFPDFKTPDDEGYEESYSDWREHEEWLDYLRGDELPEDYEDDESDSDDEL